MATTVRDIADKLHQKPNDIWDEGGAGRAALHAIAGALLGGVNGVDGAIKAAIGAGVSTAIAPYINDIVKNAVAQSGLKGEEAKRLSDTLTSSIVSALLASAGGSNGAGYASNEIKYNLLTYDETKRIIELERLMKSCALDAKCSDVDFKKYMTEIDDLINKNEKTNADFLNECQKFGKEHCDNIIVKEYFDKYQKQIAQAIKNGDPDSDELKKWLMQNYNVMSLGYNSTPSFLHKFILAMGESSQTADDIFLAGITGGESTVWRKIFSKTGGNSSATSVISKEGLKAELAAKEIKTAPRVGSATKTDFYHSIADNGYIIEQIPYKGRVFTKYGNDGKPYTLTQMEGE